MFGIIFGFLSSALPHLLDYFKEKQDNKHELDMIDMQIKYVTATADIKLKEVAAEADIAEITAIHQPQTMTGVHWIDGLTASVRPFITYAFFALYGGLKLINIYHNGVSGVVDTPWLYWTNEDENIFNAVISFWFGSRAFEKMKNGK